MAAVNKKKQKMKGKTLNLNEFLGDTGSNYVMSNKPVSWAEEVENAVEEEDYGTGTSSSTSVNRAVLPTAPRAARGPAVDLTRVPSEPPYTAFLGNLPFDASEEEIEKFFHGLVVKNIRIPPGRSKGFGYAEFEDKHTLIEALEFNDKTLRNRQIRIDLADQHGGDRDQRSDRDSWGRGRPDDDGEDKTEGDWRKAPRKDDRMGDRGGDRSFGGDRGGDRFGDRSFGGDRGGDRFGDRDRYGDRGGDRSFGERRGFDNWGGDRYGDRGGDRYGDRGGDRYGDRGGDRYGDRGGDRYGDKGSDGFGRRSFGSGYSSDRRDGSGFSSDRRDGGERSFERAPPREADGQDGKERRRLNLQPRSKPDETPAEGSTPAKPPPAPKSSSSIFGAAKPVDTAAREREIENRILREKKAEEERWEQERENRLRDVREIRSMPSSTSRPDKVTRQDSDSSQGRQRKLSSSSSGKGIRTVAPPPGAGSARVRRESTLSDDENVFDDDKSLSPKSPPIKKEETPPKMENAWVKRKEKTSISETEKEDHDKENRQMSYKSATSPPSNKPADKPSNTQMVPADPPKENVWAKRKQEQQSSTDDSSKEKHIEDPKNDHQAKSPGHDSKPKRREKPLPTSIDEMPKFEEKEAVDISDTNKFGLLPDEDGDLASD